MRNSGPSKASGHGWLCIPSLGGRRLGACPSACRKGEGGSRSGLNRYVFAEPRIGEGPSSFRGRKDREDSVSVVDANIVILSPRRRISWQALHHARSPQSGRTRNRKRRGRLTSPPGRIVIRPYGAVAYPACMQKPTLRLSKGGIPTTRPV